MTLPVLPPVPTLDLSPLPSPQGLEKPNYFKGSFLFPLKLVSGFRSNYVRDWQKGHQKSDHPRKVGYKKKLYIASIDWIDYSHKGISSCVEDCRNRCYGISKTIRNTQHKSNPSDFSRNRTWSNIQHNITALPAPFFLISILSYRVQCVLILVENFSYKLNKICLYFLYGFCDRFPAY